MTRDCAHASRRRLHARDAARGSGVIRSAIEARAVEKDRLLRQPLEPGALPDIECNLYRAVRPVGAIDFLRRLTDSGCSGPVTDRHLDILRVAADQAAGDGRDRGKWRCPGRYFWKQDAHRCALIEFGQTGLAIAMGKRHPRCALHSP